MRYLDHVSNEFFDPQTAHDGAPRAVRVAVPAPDAEGAVEAGALAAFCQQVKERAAVHRELRAAQPEVVLHALLMNEVDYVQFTGRKDEQGKRIRVHFWQAPMLLDNIVVAFCGRDVGKSTAMKWFIEHRATNYPTGSLLLSGNQDDRVKKVWGECVMKEMRSHWWAKHFFDNQDGAASSRNPYHQWFSNGFMLYGRPASEQTSHKVESPHCHAVCIDEMQEYGDLPWKKLQPAINDYEANREHGAGRKFFGVNSQGRTDNVFFDIAFQSKLYSPHALVIPSWHNPKYNVTRHTEYLETYGYSVNASEFKQMIRGMTGDRARGLISGLDYNICCVQAADHLNFKERNLFYVERQIWAQAAGNPETLFTRRLELKKWEHEHDMIVLSMDFGSTAPTEIGIWYRCVNPDPDATDKNRQLWVLWTRITIQGLPPNEQAYIIDYLNDFYGIDYLSLDSTGATDAVSQILLDPRHPLYEPKDYMKRLYPAVSNKFMPVKYVLEEPDDKNLAPAGTRWRKIELAAGEGYRLPVWALEQNSNVLSSHLVAQLIRDHVFAFSGADGDLQQELNSMTEKITPGKQPSFEGKFGQHRFSMLRSFVQWHHQYFTLKALQAKVIGDEEESFYSGYEGGCVGLARVQVGGDKGLWSGSDWA